VRLTRFRRLLVVLALAPLALGGAFSHVDGFERLSHGTFLFPPDHPAHAPFVPEKEHPCAACAIAHLTAPASAPAYLVPPDVRAADAARAELPASTLSRPDIRGRSPPLLDAA
jgi:hypothetical protein